MGLASLNFDGSWAWAKIGYGFPTRNYQTLAMGPSSNIPAILQHVYGWQIHDPVWTAPRFAELSWQTPLTTMRSTLIAIYAVLLVICAVAAARHAKKCDPKLLVALTAPWIAMFALMPQMHERYLTYAAALCGVAIASSMGLALLHIVIIGVSTTMVFHCMLAANGSQLAVHSWIARTHPHLGWMVALIAAIFVYCACTPSRRFDKPAPARQNRRDASEAS
jgi:type IV secretory pathway TrbD component